MNAAAPFLEVFASRGAATALIDARGRATPYAALARETAALARLLAARGLAPGDRVLLQVPSGPLFVAATLAVIARGAVPVLAEPGLGDAVHAARVAAAAPRFALVHPLVEALGRLRPLRRALAAREVHVPPHAAGPRTLRLTRAALRAAAATPLGRAPAPTVDVPAAHDGLLVFTGGTTAAPRGVRHSHGGLAAYLAAVGAVVAEAPVERLLADTPQQALYGLRLGATVVLAPARRSLRAAYARARFAAGDVDGYFGAPWLWQELLAGLRPGERLPPTLRTVLLGGAPVSGPFLDRLAAHLAPSTRVVVLYGLTEAGPVTSVDAAAKRAYAGPGDLVGRPLPGVTIDLGTPDDEGVGDVMVRSPSLFAGYLGEPPRPEAAPLATGDRGRLTPDGHLVLLGRAKDMIIRRGVNLYPPSFEATVEALAAPDGRPWVRRCALVGAWSDARADEDVVLAVEPGPAFAADAFAAQAREALGPDAAPDRVVVVTDWPVTGRLHKTDKVALRRLAAEGAK